MGDAKERSERGCLVAGHIFVQEGHDLIDEAVKKLPHARRVKVRFDSLEYFELIGKHPKTLPAFKGARSVTLAVGDTIYEVHV